MINLNSKDIVKIAKKEMEEYVDMGCFKRPVVVLPPLEE